MNESRYDFEILLIDRDCEYEIVRLIQIQFYETVPIRTIVQKTKFLSHERTKACFGMV